MKDAVLKNLLFRHFWAQRYFVQPEVNVHFSGGVAGEHKLITDIDVLALRPSGDLSFHRLLGDCKTLKNQSPISRALWLSGLMRFLDGHRGYIVLKNPQIERDHKLAADEIDIVLLSDIDFPVYDKAVLGPIGSQMVVATTEDVHAIARVRERFPRLEALVAYLHGGALLERHFGNSIRHTVGHLRTARGEFDPAHPAHTALFCDACAVLAIGIAECSGRIFNQYLHPAEKSLLSDSLKVLLWGGSEQYSFFQTVRQKLFQAKGVPDDSQHALELPEWNSFLQLVRTFLEKPATGFDVPWILRQLAIDLLRGRSFAASVTKADLLALKFAMLVVDYAAKASGVPTEVAAAISGTLVRLQTDLATSAQ